MSTIHEISEMLIQIKNSDCFYADADDILATYSGDMMNFSDFEVMFKFIENNPTLDYGAPGPIVHFMEHFYSNEYNEALKQSILRSPTELTLWMLNRVINALDDERKSEFISLLREVESMEVSQELKDEANSIIEYQRKKFL